MDVLVSGSEREWRLPRPPEPPPRAVAVAAVLVLVAGLVAALPVRRAELALDRLQVELLPVDSRRELVEAAFGGLVVVVRDPAGRSVRVDEVDVRVPGLLVGPLSGLPATGDEVVSTARFVVPDCRELQLPGTVVVVAAREGREPERLEREVATLAEVEGAPLLVVCGLAPRE